MDLLGIGVNVSLSQATARGHDIYHKPGSQACGIGHYPLRMPDLGEDDRLAVAETLLLSRQFSFGIKGGVQQVILGIILSLQLNPDFVEIDLDLKNAHTFSSRDKAEEELESDIIYHYLLEVFRSLYEKTVTPQWHYGDGPSRPPTIVHMSVDGFRQ